MAIGSILSSISEGTSMLAIPGNHLEGGGSIVRLSVALSCIAQKPVRVYSIRSQRKESGLRTQHLRAIEAVKEFCNGSLEGAKLGSSEIIFHPRSEYKNELNVHVETAGSVGLLLQCLALPSFYGASDVSIHVTGGGTFGTHAPNILYIQEVLVPMMKKLGFQMHIATKRHGFYPKGGADVNVLVKKVKETSSATLLERGALLGIEGVVVASSDLRKKRVCERIRESAEKTISINQPISIVEEYQQTLNPGCGILLKAVYENCIIAWDALGERNKASEAVGQEAAKGLLAQMRMNCAVDEYMADQLLVYMALSGKECKIAIPHLSTHAKTNIWLIEQFLPVKFTVKDNIITCGPVV